MLKLLSSLCLIFATFATPNIAVAQSLIAKGDKTCVYGSVDCNRCAHRVPEQFNSLPKMPNAQFKFSTRAGQSVPGMDQEILPISQEDVTGLEKNTGHVQGFSRLPGLGDNNWFAVSIDSSKQSLQPSGLMFVRMGGPVSNDATTRSGHKFASGDGARYSLPERPHPRDAVEYFFPINSQLTGLNTEHPSGFQPIGKIVPVPSFGTAIVEKAYVQFILPTLINDSSDPLGKRMIAIPIGQLRLSGIGPGPHKSARKVYAGAAAKLADGRNLLILLRSDFGHLQYYLSNPGPLSTAHWFKHRVDDTKFSRYQNMALVTECITGDLYLIGMKWKSDSVSVIRGLDIGFDPDGPWDGDSKADLYKVELTNSGKLDTSRKLSTTEFDEADESCEAKGGSGIYVTPVGRLIFYCSQGRSIAKGKGQSEWDALRFSEYVAQSEIPECSSLSGRFATDQCEVTRDDTNRRNQLNDRN